MERQQNKQQKNDDISKIQRLIDLKLKTYGFRKDSNLLYSFGIIGFLPNNKILVVPCLNVSQCTQIGKLVKVLMLEGYDVEIGSGFWNYTDNFVFDIPGTPSELKDPLKERSLERRLLERAFGTS